LPFNEVLSIQNLIQLAQLAQLAVIANVSHWLAEELSDDHWLNVNNCANRRSWDKAKSPQTNVALIEANSP